jgi:threonine/homoserine/homoserine lactone efflux protein
MDFWQGFTILTLVHLLAAASPGPDFALVTRQSLLHGRKAGILASLGISIGLSIHIIYSAAGLAAVIAHSSEWMTVIKLAGGGFLIFLGVKGLRSRPQESLPFGTRRPPPTDPGHIWRLDHAAANVLVHDRRHIFHA